MFAVQYTLQYTVRVIMYTVILNEDNKNANEKIGEMDDHSGKQC